jgi:Ca-activated chloride channel family protein
MTVEFDPYAMLGVSKKTDMEDIKHAYRKLAQRLHPDKNMYAAAEQQFRDVSRAYEILSNSVERRRYDDDTRTQPSDVMNHFTLRTVLSRRAVAPLDESQVLYMLADITAPPGASSDKQQKGGRLNLTLVLDHSRSMKDDHRMDRVKLAAQRIINELDEKDFISVVCFNDRATVIIPATQAEDKSRLRSQVSMINPTGSTEIFQGLKEGIQQNRTHRTPDMINHVVLLTDGRTYGDEQQCYNLAQQVQKEGITISTMGLGNDWNDEFLDELASITGGSAIYINSVRKVTGFMNDHVRLLSDVFAERMKLLVAPSPDIDLEMAFRLSPGPQPLKSDDGIIPLGSLMPDRSTSLLLRFQIPAHMSEGFWPLARIVATGDILASGAQTYSAVNDLSLEITEQPDTQKPPTAIVDALSKLTLYEMQEKAQNALNDGNIEEATRKLEFLATRLFERGEEQLARQTLTEAEHVRHTSKLSAEGKKTIKYQTRALVKRNRNTMRLLFDDSDKDNNEDTTGDPG